MRAVVQRVSSAKVEASLTLLFTVPFKASAEAFPIQPADAGLHWLVQVDGEAVGSIGKGLLVFVGLKANDTEKDIEYL